MSHGFSYDWVEQTPGIPEFIRSRFFTTHNLSWNEKKEIEGRTGEQRNTLFKSNGVAGTTKGVPKLGLVVGWEKTTDEPIFNGSWERRPTNGSNRSFLYLKSI